MLLTKKGRKKGRTKARKGKEEEKLQTTYDS